MMNRPNSSSRAARRSALFLACCAALLVMLLGAPSLHAQEVQIPMDEEAKFEQITPELDKELGLFSNVEGFQLARLFRVNDSSYVLEVESRAGGQSLRNRMPMNTQAMQDFRARVTQSMHARAPQLGLNQEGRTALITGVTALSFGLYGWSIPAALDMEENAAAGMYFVTAGAGFLVPFLATRNATVTDGMATLALHGGTMGIAHGWLLYWLANPDFGDDRAFPAVLTIGSITELVAGYAIAGSTNMSGGKASVISSMGYFGAGVGMLAYGMTDASYRDPIGPLLGLGGSALGYAVGAALANSQPYTAGDASVLSTAGVLGAAVPAALMSLTKSEDGNLYYGAAILGCIGGLWLGDHVVVGKDYTTSQGTLIGAGTVGGGLMGLGFGLLASRSEPQVWLSLGALGASAGFAMMVSTYADEARAAAGISSIDLTVSPIGLAALAAPSGRFGAMPVPVAGFTIRW